MVTVMPGQIRHRIGSSFPLRKLFSIICIFLLSFSLDKPEMRDGPSVIKSWINHETEVTCEAEGFPAPEIVWSRKGTVTTSTTLNSCVSIRKFSPEEKDEFGILLCSAKNLLGTGKKNITVKQLGKKAFHCFTWQVVSDQREGGVGHVRTAEGLVNIQVNDKIKQKLN